MIFVLDDCLSQQKYEDGTLKFAWTVEENAGRTVRRGINEKDKKINRTFEIYWDNILLGIQLS